MTESMLTSGLVGGGCDEHYESASVCYGSPATAAVDPTRHRRRRDQNWIGANTGAWHTHTHCFPG